MTSFDAEGLSRPSIKQEPEEVIFDVQCSPETQCGFIFFAEHRRYTFGCQICLAQFGDMEQFGAHWEEEHLTSSSVMNPKCEENEDEDWPQSEASALESFQDQYYGDSVDCSDSVVDECINSDTEIIMNEDVQDYQKILSQVPYLKQLQANSNGHEKPRYNESERFCITCNRYYKSAHAFSCHKLRHKRNQIKFKRIKLATKPTTSPKSKITATRKKEKLKITCEFCQNTFKSRRYFRLHVVSNHGNSIPKLLKNDPTYLACDRCYATFQTPLARHKHEMKHSPDDPYLCNQCPKTFLKRGYRTTHLVSHDDSRPFVCPLCNSSFRMVSELKTHIRGHLGDKPYACDLCGKRFTTVYRKKIHAKIHSREMKYECKECGMGFREKRNLYKHSYSYKHRNFKCDQCGEAFVTKYKLNQHLLKHSDRQTPTKRFNCGVCMASLKNETILKAHMQRMHPAIVSNDVEEIDHEPDNLVFYSL